MSEKEIDPELEELVANAIQALRFCLANGSLSDGQRRCAEDAMEGFFAYKDKWRTKVVPRKP
jgi:hypothetical protein